ncbi:hypothetical protein D3C76_1452170 [compost metagenome]
MPVGVLRRYRHGRAKHLERQAAMRKIRDRTQEAANGFAGAGVIPACPEMELQLLLKPLGVINLADEIQVAFGHIDLQRNRSGQDRMVEGQPVGNLQLR